MSIYLVYPIHEEYVVRCIGSVVIGATLCQNMWHNVGIQDLLGGHTHSSCLSGISDRSPHLRCLGNVFPNPDGLESRSSSTELSLVTAGYRVKARSFDILASKTGVSPQGKASSIIISVQHV